MKTIGILIQMEFTGNYENDSTAKDIIQPAYWEIVGAIMSQSEAWEIGETVLNYEPSSCANRTFNEILEKECTLPSIRRFRLRGEGEIQCYKGTITFVGKMIQIKDDEYFRSSEGWLQLYADTCYALRILFEKRYVKNINVIEVSESDFSRPIQNLIESNRWKLDQHWETCIYMIEKPPRCVS